jgi:hypothetical protein
MLGWAAGCVFAVCAVVVVLLAAPRAAGACPDLARVEAFHGYVRIDFKADG